MKPWMTNNQIEIIKSYLKPSDIVLEYGIGGSTLYFSKYVKKYLSIEHDFDWFEKIKNNYKLAKNIELHYCKPNNEIDLPVWIGKENDFLDYINYVDKLNYKIYNKVLIDGRARKFCAKKILNYINEYSLVFFHDFFERERYHDILNYYKIINEDKNNGKNPSLVVLRKN